MRPFTYKVIEQIQNVFKYNFEKDNKELIMALFMQIFSYRFDNRIDPKIKFKNISSITKTTWKKIDRRTNAFVGIPIFNDEEERKDFSLLSLDDKTEFLLNIVRGSIVHGAFEFNNDGTITIKNKNFQMTFEFDCIVDICSVIVSELKISAEKSLYDFLLFIKNISHTSTDYNKIKIQYSFANLKYPIVLFNLLPMNEDDFHNDEEYGSFILSLFSDREFYKNGRLKSNGSLGINELYKLRNCIAHGQYYSVGNDLILFDHKENFVFDCLRLDELFEKDFKQKR